MARVEFDSVSKTFPDGTRALVEFGLTVEDGELLVLVGPSGCGKSTVLRLLSGLEEPSAGTLRIGERVVNALPPQERNVAMVFQDYALYPHMTVRQNLAFPLKMRKLARAAIAERVERVARLLEIEPLLERLPKQLSGGQRQRVAMGRALVREPAVFLLDEPLSNLDAKLRVQVRAEIAELRRRTGTTMIYVTHDQVEAMTLGDRIAVLERGVLQQVAPPDELYSRPLNTFVAGFIGNPPMNLLAAHAVRGAGGGAEIHVAGMSLAWPGAVPEGDGAVTLGIRPEALALADAGVPAEPHGTLAATVEHVEWIGHETLLHARLAATDPPARVIARLGGLQPFERDAAVRLAFPLRSALLFDAAGRLAGHKVSD